MTEPPRDEQGTRPAAGTGDARLERRSDVATRLLLQALAEEWCTDADLATALGVSQLELARFGSREARMSPEQRLRLADRLAGCAPSAQQVFVSAIHAAAVADVALREAAETSRPE